jgi:putative restriction endonuclease
MNIYDLISTIEHDQQRALSWFQTNAGKDDVPYTPKFDGLQIVSPAQGIYKPATSDYVLSVKETLKGSYPDQKPVYSSDGSWFYYAYHQQGDNSKSDRDGLSVNRALMKNINDNVPVGVARQTQQKGRTGAKYKIDVALPVGWVEGFFILVGASPAGEIPDQIDSPEEIYRFILKENQAEIVKNEGFFDPSSVVDERKKAFRAVVQRQGQPAFRKNVLRAYESKCPITGCDVKEALEAAHISPYMGVATNSVQNGLPLRGDIHTLWDLGLICVNTSNMTIVLHPKLRSSDYEKFQGIKLQLPKDSNDAPSKAALDEHRDFCGF